MEDHFPESWVQDADWDPSSSNVLLDEHYLVPSLDLEPHDLDSSSSGNATFIVDGYPTNPSWGFPVQEGAEDRAASASKSHSLAEKRRRDRINAQLGTLRRLIPHSDKMDKAALLASVIDHVKELKRNAAQVSKSMLVPSEVDEVTVDYELPIQTINSNNQMGTNNTLFRACLSCEDRPELFPELIRMISSLKLIIVRADIASVGGRIKSILVLGNNKDNKDVVSLVTIKQSLNVVLSRIGSSSMPSNFRVRSKRQRFFLPSYQSQLPLGY